MKPLFARLALFAGAAGILAAAALPISAQQVETASSVDLKRFAGRWYEIARIPNGVQQECVGNTTADYRLMDGGAIEVANRCKTADGKIALAMGQAKVVDKTGNAKLQVRFAPSWLSWLPMVWSDYWIIQLDSDYTVATVGSPNRETLWILSRTPTLPSAEYESRVNNATRQGFDTSKLLKTLQ